MRPIALGLCLLAISCHLTPQRKYVSEAQKASAIKDWSRALEYYEKTVKVSPESQEALLASREASKIALVEARDYSKLTVFLRHIIHHAKSQQERISAQKLLAEIYFDKLNDYKAAIIEINRALEHYKTGKEAASLRLMLARAHFFLNDFYQAKSEIEFALRDNADQEFLFRAQLLKASILFNEKKLDEAILIYQKMMAEYPDKAKAEQVALSLAVCYEDKEDFQKAIEVLEKMKDDQSGNEIIDVKIKRLQERQAQAPGARGLRK